MVTTNNGCDQKFINNADGFTLGGGTTERDLTVTGGNITLSGSGTNTYTPPASTSTLASLQLNETFSGNKTFSGKLISTSSFAIERTTVADTAYTQQVTDCTIAYTSLTAARIVTLITSGMTTGQIVVVKDEAGTAGTNNITLSGVNVDGASSYVINTNYGFVILEFNGSTYDILSRAYASGGTVTGLTSPNATLTIGGTTALTADIDLTHSNAWTAAQSIASSSATAFAVGLNGTTNPAFSVDDSTASSVSGITVKSGATGTGASITSITSDTNGAGLNLTIAGKAATASGVGGAILINGGNGNGAAGVGGALTFTAGTGATNNVGGAVTISAGSSGNSSTGGAAIFQGGAGVSGAGGAASLLGGGGQSGNNGGAVTVQGGAGGSTATGGQVNITGGTSGTSSGTAGNVVITGGASGGSSTGVQAGSVTIQGGVAHNSAGGNVTLQGSAGNGTNQNGGNVTITGGAATGSGTAGTISLSSLSSNGLVKTSGGTGLLSIATAGTDYQAPITLTTTGTSGAATFIGNTLNIPQYTGGGGGTPGGSNTQMQYNNSGAFGGVANSNVSDASGYVWPRVYVISMPGPRIVANDVTNWVVMGRAGKFSKAWVIAKTGPTGASVILDIQKSTNNGSTFATLWGTNPTNKPTIAAASNNGSTTSFDTTTFAAGDVLRFDIDQVGSTIAGSDITLVLETFIQNT